MKTSPGVWVVAGLGAVAALANGGAIADAIFGAFVLGFPALLIDRTIKQRRSPQSPQADERPEPLQPTTVNVVEKSEVTETEPEVTKPSRDEGGRNMGSGERMESVMDGVDDDPEVARLREALDAAEREVEQRLEERRQAAEADLLKAETAKRVGELARELEQVEAKLAQLDDPDWTPGTATPSGGAMKLHRKLCRCGSLVDMPASNCPTCTTFMANQFHARSSYLCGNCSQTTTESSESCSNCKAVFQV